MNVSPCKVTETWTCVCRPRGHDRWRMAWAQAERMGRESEREMISNRGTHASTPRDLIGPALSLQLCSPVLLITCPNSSAKHRDAFLMSRFLIMALLAIWTSKINFRCLLQAVWCRRLYVHLFGCVILTFHLDTDKPQPQIYSSGEPVCIIFIASANNAARNVSHDSNQRLWHRIGCACLLFEDRKHYRRLSVKKSKIVNLSLPSRRCFCSCSLQPVCKLLYKLAANMQTLHAHTEYFACRTQERRLIRTPSPPVYLSSFS